jgi:hypothetical protein
MSIFRPVLRPILRRFAREETGSSQSLELLLVFPLLIWALCGFYVYTDAFKIRTVLTDATALIADTLSRQSVPITQDDLDGLQSIIEYMSNLSGGADLRITQVACIKKCEDMSKRELEVIFSRGNGYDPLTTNDFALNSVNEDRVPRIDEGDRIVVVDTRMYYAPAFNFGLNAGDVETRQIVRMRFAPQLCWESCGTTS